MTHTLIECGACGWRSADHATTDDAAHAGVLHLAEAHPAMHGEHGGKDQVRMFAYLTLAEYLDAHGAEPSEEPEGENGEKENGEDKESGEDEEPSPSARVARPAPRHTRKREPQDKSTRRRR